MIRGLMVGVLLLSALVANAATNSLKIANLVISRHDLKVGEPVELTMNMANLGTNDVTSFSICYYVNGEVTGETHFDERISAGRKGTVHATINLNITGQALQQPFKAVVESVNGMSVSVPSEATDFISVYEDLFPRNVLIEEGTGTWCGWCVKGIVAIRKMQAAHPDDFIGIAVHNNDALTVDEYDSAMGFTNFPSCNIDRTYLKQQVDTSLFETYYQFEKARLTPGSISLTATPDDEKGTISLTATSKFSYTGEGKYNCAFVLVEDSVTCYNQNNEYAGGTYGKMGGFEDQPSTASIVLNDVARGIYPSYMGQTLTEQVEKGHNYTCQYDLQLPKKIQHRSHLSVVALLINAEDSCVVNAVKIAVPMKDAVNTETSSTAHPNAGDFRYVDLGLSVCWAAGNMLGEDGNFGEAETEDICGGYFGWADPTGLLHETDDSYYPQGEVPTEISNTEYDIAHVKWGSEWRLPTHEEVKELYENCSTKVESVNNVTGIRFTSLNNGNSIFFPFNGSRNGDDVWSVGEYGSYWTGTLYPEPLDGIYYVYELDFDAYAVNINNLDSRNDGCGVRPVCNAQASAISSVKTSEHHSTVAVYTLDGRQVRSFVPNRIYIIRQKDGSVKKILKK